MKYLNVELSNYTTLKVGGRTPALYKPKNYSELLCLLGEFQKTGEPYRILGNGSNLIIDDKGISQAVVQLKSACAEIKHIGNGVVECGAGVPLAKFVSFCISKELFAYPGLASIPATLGGAIFMNAGNKGLYISRYLHSVTVFINGEIVNLFNDECEFSYRESIFLSKPSMVILNARFTLPTYDSECSRGARRSRHEYTRIAHDLKYPNAGTVFSKANPNAMNFLKGIRVGGCGWSSLTGNWIVNYGYGTCSDILKLINLGRVVNQIFGVNPRVELIHWK